MELSDGNEMEIDQCVPSGSNNDTAECAPQDEPASPDLLASLDLLASDLLASPDQAAVVEACGSSVVKEPIKINKEADDVVVLELTFAYFFKTCEFMQDFVKRKNLTKGNLESTQTIYVRSYSCIEVENNNSEKGFLFECPYKNHHCHKFGEYKIVEQNPDGYSYCYETLVKPNIWLDINKEYDNWGEKYMLLFFKFLQVTYLKCLTEQNPYDNLVHSINGDSQDRLFLILAVNATEPACMAKNYQYLYNLEGVGSQHVRIVIPTEVDVVSHNEPILVSFPLSNVHANDQPEQTPYKVELVHPVTTCDNNHVCLFKRLIYIYSQVASDYITSLEEDDTTN